MIDLLRERPGITISEMARAVHRSERTVYRWLN
ncbi:MAG: helix-turn-helix domain-containing protein, partial [Armatimonadota bacterium]